MTASAHVFAGATPVFWIAFHAIVAVLLIVDLAFLQRSKHVSIRAAWGWTVVLAAMAFCFALFLSRTQGREPALEFLSGYLVEGSLSVDNLFVFLLMFRSLKLDVDQQRRVLLWGVLGAIVMRALFIAVGTSLLHRFAWVEYVFGAFLIYAAIRLLKHKEEDEGPSGPMRWLQQCCLQNVNGKPAMSAFLLIVLAVEATDLIFALDSIPAVLAITRNTFIVYTSNIFAILGLRSLYFALSSALDKLRLLHYGLALILAFVGVKMLISKWVDVPVTWSLGFILLVLAIFSIASRLTAKPA
ncbi:TerC/Alx family metal homeostasis membrane protein [Silvibacterium dinghuense]|uniref:TerC/Alx family metal homeostasis membrane protein n=1 Tax=Silvibacterium dinghuense TaxID=1560006 RepID=A0A4Q1SEH5_9BACT|nr:TerC/Alx family metal homeostasis membrane protein [Silvibacterium dinghuense]RXS95527.1 TerC/Alx family metal homeostasis membrane protein [Silvibacterium dinghuense]GGH13783.1 membrane protein [Silvibacterium dinghuense]